MKDYRNFILINNGKKLATTFYANCSSEASIQLHDDISTASMLKIVNQHLYDIRYWKENGLAVNVYYILIPSKLCKLIKDKSYKNLLKSDKVSTIEKWQWQLFEGIYKEVFADIVFKSNNTYDSNNINKAYKHIIYTKKLIDKMYALLDENNIDSAQIINN